MRLLLSEPVLVFYVSADESIVINLIALDVVIGSLDQ